MSGILWIIFVGFVAGLIARWLSPGPNTPGGFILTTVLGIAGAFLATFLRTDISFTIATMFALAVLSLTASLLLFLREKSPAKTTAGSP